MPKTAYIRNWEDRKHAFPPVTRAVLLEQKLPPMLSSRGGGPFDLKVIRDGDPDPTWSVKRKRTPTLERVDELLPKKGPLDVGDRIRIRDAASNVLRVVVVDAAPTVELPSTADRWHPLLRELYVDIFGRTWKHGKPFSMGFENCRKMNLVSDPPNPPWSMHSWWPPVLAGDIGFGTLALGDEVVAWVKAQPKYDQLVIVWRVPLHFNHGHFQVGPNRSGVPACA